MHLDALIDTYIESSRDLRVCVIGETILDEFIEVAYEGNSMKSNCPVFRLTGGRSVQEGGAGAIANHLRGFVGHLDLITNTGGEIVKTRYIDVNDGVKHVEINKFDTKNFGPFEVDTRLYDLVIVADFGHKFCDPLIINDGFHLMCQTNSNNFGFNRVSKWKRHQKKSICLDLREGSLQMNAKIDPEDSEKVLELFHYELNTEDMYLTIGAKGALYTDGRIISRQPSFPSDIVDTIGAGDAFFSFAALSSALGIPQAYRMVLPALAASLTTTWLCNEQSVSPEKLKAYAARFVPESLS